jgi:hypothetical protein
MTPEAANVQLQGRLTGSHAQQRISELVVTKHAIVILVGVACNWQIQK